MATDQDTMENPSEGNAQLNLQFAYKGVTEGKLR